MSLIFLGYSCPIGSEISHNVAQLEPYKDQFYQLKPNLVLLPFSIKFLPETIRAIARNSNIDLQSIGKYYIQHHICTQQNRDFLESLKMDTIQRQSIIEQDPIRIRLEIR